MAENNKKKVAYRIANFDDSIVYKLSKAKTVTISKNAWEVSENHLNLFAERPMELPQVEPIKSDNGLDRLDKYLNISEDEKLLLKVYLVGCFNPSIYLPTICIKGELGSGKTVLASMLKELIDPSVDKLHSVNGFTPSDLIVLLSNSYFEIFDNVYKLSPKRKEMFLLAITRAFSNREKYRNNESMRYDTRLCFTGNPQFLEYADISERTLLFTMKPLDENRVVNYKLHNDFNADLPFIMGGIFDLLATALDIQQYINLENPIRLADFHRFGYAVAEAMGGCGDRFTDILKNHTEYKEVLNGIMKNDIDSEELNKILDNYLGSVDNG